jgi:hypothetical protein
MRNHHARIALGLLLCAACGIESGPVDSTDVGSAAEAPCGDATVAVLTDEQGATYAFCAHPEAGPLVLESLPSAAARSRLDEEPDMEALFDSIHPASVQAPEWVRASLIAGEKIGDEDAYRWAAPPAEVQAVALAGSCADPDTFFDDALTHWQTLIREFATPTFNRPGWECVDEAIFENDFMTHTLHTVSNTPITDDGACAVAGRVLGCGSGDTILTGDVRGTAGSGSWSNFFTLTIHSGGFGKVKQYGNAAHNCHPDYDRDDFRIRAVSESGAWHHYAAIFINRARSIWNTCFVPGLDPE